VRRSLIATVAATVAMVLVAMLVPMAFLVQSYALEDRLAQAALEVQATESVVSGNDDRGAVSFYVDRINDNDHGIRTTVLYPATALHPDGLGIGPDPTEDARVDQARETGQARVDTTDDGAEILVPVSLGGSSTLPERTPVVRVLVAEPGLGSGVLRAWLVLGALAVVLLAGAVVLADRLGRSFVRPLAALAAHAERLGDRRRERGVIADEGPPEVRALGSALARLVDRIEVLLERERRGVSDLSHRLRTPITAMRLRLDGLPDDDVARLAGDLDELEGMVDHLVTQARRSEREGLVAECDATAVLTDRTRFWVPLAEDQGRRFDIALPSQPVPVSASERDLGALVDALLDNVFTHTADGVRLRIEAVVPPGGGLRILVEDEGPGYPDDLDVAGRGVSGGGSSGLGLSIVATTAEESGGSLELGRSATGGARTTVHLGARA